MVAGYGALSSTIGHLRKKLPKRDQKISVVYMNRDGSIDWPELDKINKGGGALVIPQPFPQTEEGMLQWELSCVDEEEDQKGDSSPS